MSYRVEEGADVLDSRDVVGRLEELRSVALDCENDGTMMEDDDLDELAALEKLCSEGESEVSDWSYGEALIADHYFTTYAQELANDIGERELDTWPHRHIDWNAAAYELKQDYVALTYGSTIYWARSC